MSDFRVEKRRVSVELALSTGTRVRGDFFLAVASPIHSGPERICELLNAQSGFFPFELQSMGDQPGRVVLFNRAHVCFVQLPDHESEPQRDESYRAAPQKSAEMLFSTGERVTGVVHVFQPVGRDRLSDFAVGDELFRYLETPKQTLIVNFNHVVEIVPIAE